MPFGPPTVSGTYGDWQLALRALPAATDMRDFMEQWFTPSVVSGRGAETGLFRGYYEAELRVSLTHHGE